MAINSKIENARNYLKKFYLIFLNWYILYFIGLQRIKFTKKKFLRDFNSFMQKNDFDFIFV